MNTNSQIQNILFSLLFELKASLAKSMKGNSFGVTPMHHRALAYVYRFPGTTQQEMVNNTGRDKAQITRLLNELEKKGLVSRSRDDTDKRVFRLQLTEKGMDAFLKLKQYEDAVMTTLLKDFPDEELEQLKHSLVKMRSNLISR